MGLDVMHGFNEMMIYGCALSHILVVVSLEGDFTSRDSLRIHLHALNYGAFEIERASYERILSFCVLFHWWTR